METFHKAKAIAIEIWCSSLQKDLKLCEPWPIQVEVKDPKTQKVTTAEASLMLPHLLFSSLYLHYRDQFEDLFAVKQCESFWQNLEKKKDPRLVPPITLGKRVVSPGTTIPIFVTWGWCGICEGQQLNDMELGEHALTTISLATHLLLTAWPKSCQTPNTWKPLDKVISWSFTALAKGYHPTEDWEGNPWQKVSLEIWQGSPWQKVL